MSPSEYILFVLVCANSVATAFVLWKLTDLDKSLEAFLGKYYKRRFSK